MLCKLSGVSYCQTPQKLCSLLVPKSAQTHVEASLDDLPHLIRPTILCAMPVFGGVFDVFRLGSPGKLEGKVAWSTTASFVNVSPTIFLIMSCLLL